MREIIAVHLLALQGLAYLHPALDHVYRVNAHPGNGTCQPACYELHRGLRGPGLCVLLLLYFLRLLVRWLCGGLLLCVILLHDELW
jgi:hypothetical protein